MVDLQSLTKEELNEMSMVEAAFIVMANKRQPFNFYDLLEEVAKLKGMSETEMDERISFLYTDLNLDGRFLTLGDNTWGLRSWYPHEQAEEEITHSAKPAKRRKSGEDDGEEEYDLVDELEEDEFEDLEDELDELADEEDQDGERDDFDDKDDALPGFDEDAGETLEEED